jgi:hypothetical protein
MKKYKLVSWKVQWKGFPNITYRLKVNQVKDVTMKIKGIFKNIAIGAFTVLTEGLSSLMCSVYSIGISGVRHCFW